MCEKTLKLFGVLDGSDWASDPALHHLNQEERERLAENTRELLLLLAWARMRSAPDDKAVLRDALALVERAEAVPDLAPTPALLEERAEYLEKLGEKAEADAARKKAKELAPTTARDHYLLATTHIRAGRFDQALKALDEAIRLNPRHYWSWVQRGLVYLDRRDFVGSIGDFGVCIGLDPHFAWGYFNRAYAFEQSGNKVKAIADYTAAIACDPGFVMAYQNRATIRIELGELDKALADLDKAIALRSDESAVHAARALALEKLRRYDEAETAFAAALVKADTEKTRPGEEEPALRIRWTYGFSISERKPDLARKLFEEVVARNASHPQALYGLAMLLMGQDKNDDALPLFDRALKADPRFTHARRFRAVVLARGHQFEEALKDLKSCLDSEKPTSGATLYAAACVASLIAEATPPNDDAAVRRTVQQAFAYLNAAFHQGYGPGRVDGDPDLAFVRGFPECRRFLKK